MNLMHKLSVFSLTLFFASVAMGATQQGMVQSEYAFGRAVKEHGLRDGFLQYLDDGAIAFAPQPTDAKAFYGTRPEGPSTLTWYPVMARLSVSGDFGFTTGPWQVSFKGRDGKPAIMHGDYATIWHRNKNGEWRWLLDAGVVHPQPEGKSAPLPDNGATNIYSLRGATKSDSSKAAQLKDMDVKYTELATHTGMRAVYSTLGTGDMRLLQFNSLPIVGLETVVKQTPMEKAELQWIASGSGIAASGDMGYTYGMAYPASVSNGKAPQSVYLHIWQHTEHGWKLLLDLEDALPPPRKR